MNLQWVGIVKLVSSLAKNIVVTTLYVFGKFTYLFRIFDRNLARLYWCYLLPVGVRYYVYVF
jgi:hypothetical protein